jgi:peptidoglycan hydrolase FlgJ
MYQDIRSLSPTGSIAETQIGLSHVLPVGAQDRQGLVDLRNAAHEFEAYFISHMLKVMRETVPKGGALENKGGAYFYSFYDQEIGRLTSEAGGLGLAKMIHEYMEKSAQPLKFLEPRTDIIVDKDHIPALKRGPG